MTRVWQWVADRPLRAAVLCAGLGVLVHANALGNEFAYDDVHIIVENPRIQSLGALPQTLLQPYWPRDFGQELGLWRPATTLALGLQWAVWQDLAWPYHLVNVLAHGAATALVVLVVSLLAPVPVGLLAGLVFAVHPVHVEAIANIVGLAEIQAAVFFLWACLIHLQAAPALDPGARYGARRITGVTALYLGAFLTKESAVTLPGVLFLLDCARERIGLADVWIYLRRRAALFSALVAAAGAVLLLRIRILGSVASPLGPLGADFLGEGVPRIWTVAGIWTHYMRLMVFPRDLASDYSPNVLPIALGWNALNVVGVVLALAVLFLAWVGWRDRALASDAVSSRLAAFGVLWFVITISPISNVFFLAGVLLAERTLYLPSVGAAVVAGWLLWRLFQERRRAAVALTVLAIALMSLRAWTRTPTWENMDTVFTVMVRDYPQSGRSQWVLGDSFYSQGRTSEALLSYRAAIGLLGAHQYLLIEISKKLMNEKPAAARFLLSHAWEQDSTSAVAPGYLAISHFQTSEWPEAERYARATLERSPDDAIMSHILASSLTAQGRYGEAIPWREHAIGNGEDESWEQWISLARLRLTVGDSTQAELARDSALARAGTIYQVRQIGTNFVPY